MPNIKIPRCIWIVSAIPVRAPSAVESQQEASGMSGWRRKKAAEENASGDLAIDTNHLRVVGTVCLRTHAIQAAGQAKPVQSLHSQTTNSTEQTAKRKSRRTDPTESADTL